MRHGKCIRRKNGLALPASIFPFEGAKVTMLNDVLRQAKYNFYGDKYAVSFSTHCFCTSFSRFNPHFEYSLNIAGPFNYTIMKKVISITHQSFVKNCDFNRSPITNQITQYSNETSFSNQLPTCSQKV